MRLIGTLLAVFGAVLLVYGGITFFVPAGGVDAGPLSIRLHENLVIPLTPIAGLVFLVIGIAMMASAPAAMPPPPPPRGYP